MEKPKKLLDIVREKIRVKHYSYSTEKTYVHWIKQYIFHHNKKHPIEMGKEEIEQFLTYLAVHKKVSPTTQNQAFSAVLFLYKQVLGIDLSDQNIQALRAQERKHISQVLTKEEVQQVIEHLDGIYQLIVMVMYGCGLRMSEALQRTYQPLCVPSMQTMHNTLIKNINEVVTSGKIGINKIY
jgi:site-specific recombinase XerD